MTAVPVDNASDYPILRLAAEPGDLAVLFHDVHFPIPDPGAVSLLVEACQVLKPRHAIADGDIFDYAPLSSHRRNAWQALEYGSLAREAEVGRPVMQAIRAAVPHCVYKRGNHEERAERLVDDIPALHGLEWWHPVADAVAGWDCLPGDPAIRLANLLIFHGHEIGGTIGQSPARRVLARYPGQNTYFGHCHQIDQATTPTSKEGRQVVHGAWTGGHLSNSRLQHYAVATRDRWAHGFSVVEVWEDNHFTVHPVRVFRDSRGLPIARVLGRTLRG